MTVNYPMAVAGAILGGALGTLAWWGFTALTHIAFGLVAVAIGFLVGHGAMRFADGKRTVGLQVLAVGVAAVCFIVATYLVNISSTSTWPAAARPGGYRSHRPTSGSSTASWPPASG